MVVAGRMVDREIDHDVVGFAGIDHVAVEEALAHDLGEADHVVMEEASVQYFEGGHVTAELLAVLEEDGGDCVGVRMELL